MVRVNARRSYLALLGSKAMVTTKANIPPRHSRVQVVAVNILPQRAIRCQIRRWNGQLRVSGAQNQSVTLYLSWRTPAHVRKCGPRLQKSQPQRPQLLGLTFVLESLLMNKAVSRSFYTSDLQNPHILNHCIRMTRRTLPHDQSQSI